MIKSMTGYGKAEAILETGKITVEVRSLNGKTADISIKTSILPKDKEMVVRHKIADALTRGNIDFFVTFEPNTADSAKKINMDLAMEYYQQIFELGKKIQAKNESRIGAENLWTQNPNDLLAMIIRMPEVMDAKKQDVITEENWPVVEACIDEALRNINAFRGQEGEILYKDVTEKVNSILNYSAQVEQYENERTEAIREKILSRFAELKAEPDQSRLEQEMIFYIEKLDINEEKVRLRQHCRYFLDTLENEPNPGKKLGFIAQEMGREINTTGSKANHTEIQKIVVKMKDELEKIKEQSLNIL
ncbi:MAG: YicC family protein [Bacteroidales bacterium]|nr:YicC family protein [Bacteroidales bacterium]